MTTTIERLHEPAELIPRHSTIYNSSNYSALFKRLTRSMHCETESHLSSAYGCIPTRTGWKYERRTTRTVSDFLCRRNEESFKIIINGFKKERKKSIKFNLYISNSYVVHGAAHTQKQVIVIFIFLFLFLSISRCLSELLDSSLSVDHRITVLLARCSIPMTLGGFNCSIQLL